MSQAKQVDAAEMKQDGLYSVLVSVTHECEDLAELHGALLTELDKLGVEYELLFLLLSAPENAARQAREIQQADPETVRVLEFAPTVGKAGSLAAGIERSRGEVILTLPGRFEIDLGVLSALDAAIKDGADLAFASRKRGPAGVSARIQSELFNRLVSLAAGTHYHDVASETRAFRRRVVDETPLYGDFYRYLPLLADRLGFQVLEVPASQDPRVKAPVVHALRIYLWRAMDVLSIFFISRFTRHPLRLFGGVGSGFAALGVLILLVAVVQRLTGTPLADRPVLVLGTLLVGLGVQAFTIGLLGELILFFHARGIRDYRVSAVYEGSEPLAPIGSSPDEGASAPD